MSAEDVPPATPSNPAASAAPSPSPASASGFARNPSFNAGPGLRPMRRPETPRRLKNGIRLRRREGIELLAWPAEAWSALLLAGVDDAVKAEALDYARAGQTAVLQISAAGIEASVQGRASQIGRAHV